MLLRLTVCTSLIACMIGRAADSKPKAPAKTAASGIGPFAAGTVSGPTASPLSFTSNDPDAPATATATVTWTFSGVGNGPANLAVQASASTLANCPAVPVSAISIRCTSVNGTGGNWGCVATTNQTLGASPITLASATKEGPNDSFTANLTFTFADAWKYPASSACSTSLTYTLTY